MTGWAHAQPGVQVRGAYSSLGFTPERRLVEHMEGAQRKLQKMQRLQVRWQSDGEALEMQSCSQLMLFNLLHFDGLRGDGMCLWLHLCCWAHVDAAAAFDKLGYW